jgi:hypothetical protein
LSNDFCDGRRVILFLAGWCHFFEPSHNPLSPSFVGVLLLLAWLFGSGCCGIGIALLLCVYFLVSEEVKTR